jgi:hypothetical protein
MIDTARQFDLAPLTEIENMDSISAIPVMIVITRGRWSRRKL